MIIILQNTPTLYLIVNNSYNNLQLLSQNIWNNLAKCLIILNKIWWTYLMQICVTNSFVIKQQVETMMVAMSVM